MAGYGEYGWEYFEKGWVPLPLPHARKKNPPSGYSGHDGVKPSAPDVLEWVEARADGNVALHLRDGIIGIDVDAYGEKTGEACLNEAIRRWGPLPETVISSSRTDRVSGIRLYRVPADMEFESIISFPEKGLGHIEILQRKHRYAVVYPSIHPDTGMTYKWFDAHWNEVGIPAVSELPELPQSWIDGLQIDPTVVSVKGNPDEFLATMTPGSPSKAVREALTRGRKAIVSPESRHDAAMKSVLHLLRLAEQGEPGVPEALQQFKKDFVARVAADRGGEVEAAEEFNRMVLNERGHSLIASTPSVNAQTLTGHDFQYGGDYDAPAATDTRVDGVRNSVPGNAGTDIRSGVAAPSDDSNSNLSEEWSIFDDVDPTMDEAVANVQSAIAISEINFFEHMGVDPNTDVVTNEATTQDRSELRFVDRLYSIDDLRRIPPAAPMIDRILYRNTLAQISGLPGSYKSFFVLGMACAVASRLEKWCGYTVAHHGPVIYVAAEGLAGMRVRVEAWCQENNQDPDTMNIQFFPDAFDLDSADDVNQVIEMVLATKATLVVIDTRARVSGALDENSATDQGLAIREIERIRKANQCTVLAVHHTGKSGVSGRGSNAWDGAAWTVLESTSPESLKINVHINKHKDVEAGKDVVLALRKVIVSDMRMPEFSEEVDRTTLVPVEVDHRQERESDKDISHFEEIRRLLQVTAGNDGFSRTALRTLLMDKIDGLGWTKGTADRRITQAHEAGYIKKIDSSKRLSPYIAGVPPEQKEGE